MRKQKKTKSTFHTHFSMVVDIPVTVKYEAVARRAGTPGINIVSVKIDNNLEVKVPGFVIRNLKESIIADLDLDARVLRRLKKEEA